MKRLFLSILIVVLSLVSIQASPITPLDSKKTKAPWAYVISTPDGGTRVTTEENGTTISHNYAKTELYTLKTGTEGLRFTVVETNQPERQANGFCFFVFGEFTVRDANGTPIEYTVTSNADHNDTVS